MDFTPQACATIRDHIVMSIEKEHPKTLGQIDALPGDKDLTFTPHAKAMPFAKLLMHSYECGPFFCNMIDGKGTKDYEEPKTRAALRAACVEMFDEFVRRAKAMTPQQLAQKYDFFGMGMYPGIIHLDVHLKHLIHHRGQAQTYLRIMGAKCPPVYGPTADVSFEELSATMAAAKN